jgi:hypothetical protein
MALIIAQRLQDLNIKMHAQAYILGWRVYNFAHPLLSFKQTNVPYLKRKKRKNKTRGSKCRAAQRSKSIYREVP